jgi:LysM repeat protein
MQTTIYTVRPGDTLWDISRKFGVSIGDIARDNRITNPDRIYSGQRLIITKPPLSNVYMVRFGDTLTSIARKFNTTVQELARINNIQNPDMIYDGQFIRVR